MDGDCDMREKRNEEGRKGSREKERKKGRKEKEKEKGDTFITRRRATGKIERQVVLARGNLPGPCEECKERRAGVRTSAVHAERRSPPLGSTGGTCGVPERVEGTAYGSRDTRASLVPPRETIFYAK